jgi:hypothetical protein
MDTGDPAVPQIIQADFVVRIYVAMICTPIDFGTQESVRLLHDTLFKPTGRSIRTVFPFNRNQIHPSPRQIFVTVHGKVYGAVRAVDVCCSPTWPSTVLL